LLLQNGAEMVNMVFNTVNDYRSEKSVNIANGLKVLASAPYQVIVKLALMFLLLIPLQLQFLLML
jgi:hypothetical protein